MRIVSNSDLNYNLKVIEANAEMLRTGRVRSRADRVGGRVSVRVKFKGKVKVRSRVQFTFHFVS